MNRDWGNLIVRHSRLGLFMIPSTNPRELAKVLTVMHSCAPQAMIQCYDRHHKPIEVQVNELEPTDLVPSEMYGGKN